MLDATLRQTSHRRFFRESPDEKIARLRDEIETLREENLQLCERLARAEGRGDIEAIRVLFDFTEAEARIFALLLHCGSAEYRQIEDAVYESGRLAELEDAQWAIRSHVKRMRKKMRPFTIDFETIYSFGYRFRDDQRAAARGLIAGYKASGH